MTNEEPDVAMLPDQEEYPKRDDDAELADCYRRIEAIESSRSALAVELEAARRDNRSLNERLYAALKDAGEAEADSSFALQSLAALRADAADEKLIDDLIARTEATRKVHRMVRAELLETAEAERDALAAKLREANARIIDLQFEPASLAAVVLLTEEKLENAMAVVESALELTQDEPCAFCPGRPEVLALGVGRPHDPNCPLVAQGFIDRDGHRLEAAGKGGA